MKTTFASVRLLAAISLGAITIAPLAQAHAKAPAAECVARAQTIKASKTRLAALTADRDELALAVEDAGDMWEAAESTRLFGPEDAARADAALAEYERLKSEFETTEADLQRIAGDFNARVSTYNRECATN